MRLIDADALMALINNSVFTADMTTTLAVNMATRWIENAPTIEPGRKTGKWSEKKVTYIDDLEAKDIITEWQSEKCSACGKYHTTPYMYYFSDYDYCPNCGADMRGERDDESRSNSNAQTDTRARGMGTTDKSSGI